MSDRYNVLSKTENVLWVPESPIAITASALVEDKMQDSINAQIKFQNISEKTIENVALDIHCYSVDELELKGIDDHVFAHLGAKTSEFFGDEKLIPLPDKTTCRINIQLRRVVFLDGSVWDNASGKPLCQLNPPDPIASLGTEL
jgi:hypothetical protein